MRNAPDWLKEARAQHGARVVAGTETAAEAELAVTVAIVAHPEFLSEQAAVLARAHVAAWVKVNASSGDLFQDGLFPRIPVLMTVSVGRKMRTADMTLDDLEHAKSMVLTRIKNVREAADQDRRDFLAFYKQVKPLLAEGGTVGDALADLAVKAA
jgi:hypothetical protein